MKQIITLHDIFSVCTAEQVFLLGQVACAHSNRKFVREKVRVAAKELAVAESNRRSFGLFEDQASFYEERKAAAQEGYSIAVSMKVSAEKFYKKLCHVYLEKGGQRHLLEQFVKHQQAQSARKVND